MCFGSTKTASASVAASAAIAAPSNIAVRERPASGDYSNAADALDAEYVRAETNKKGKRTADAFDVLGTLVRARRDNDDARIREVLDEFVTSLR
jgi:hypothetical protein